MLGPYRRLLEGREARRLVLASAAARLAIGAFVLPLLLAVQQATGSFAAAGAAAGAFSLGTALAAPARGRLVDRRGARTALPALAVASGAALALVAALAEVAAPAWLVLLAGVSGAATPPLVASMRLEWQRLLGTGDARLGAAYAFETGVQTTVFIVGPLLAAAGIATIGARASLAVTAALLLGGTLGYAWLALTPPMPRGDADRSPIRLPGVLTLVLATLLADLALGAADVVVPAFADERGRPELAGVVLAAFAVGAVGGALVYGARPWPLSLAGQLAAVCAAGAATVAALALPSSFVLLGVLLLVAGAPSAVQWAAASLALDRAAGGRAGAEAFTWLSAANAVGVGLGSVLGGVAVEAWGTGTAFLLAAAGPALAALLLLARRRTLA